MKALNQSAVDSRRLLLTALSVMTQILNRREPSDVDVQYLKSNAVGYEVYLDTSQLANSIIRRETDLHPAERKLG